MPPSTVYSIWYISPVKLGVRDNLIVCPQLLLTARVMFICEVSAPEGRSTVGEKHEVQQCAVVR